MSDERLNPISYVVLGTLATIGPLNPYEMKQRIGNAIAYFWSFSHSQFYDEPARLAKLGLLHEEQEDHGRRRRQYSITEAGRAAMREWFEEPTETRREIRDLGIVKLFFSDLAEPGQIAQLIEQQLRIHRKILEHYEFLHRQYGDRAERGNQVVTIEMGRLFETAMVEFWHRLEVDDDGSVHLGPPSS